MTARKEKILANRHTLHISHLEAFKEWLEKNGWMIGKPFRNPYEVLKATKPGKRYPLIIYQKSDAKQHLSILDRDMPVVRAFLRDIKKPKTNADKIRSMSDEELAEFMGSFFSCEYSCAADEDGYCLRNGECIENIMKWLKAEVEE